MLEQDPISAGRELYDRRLQSTRSGNISVRHCDCFVITKTGSNLGRLAPEDLISVPLNPAAPIPPLASGESSVHRAIYNATSAGAVVHAHGRFAIALAEIEAAGVRPVHNEAIVALEWIPIIDTTVVEREGGEDPEGNAEALSNWKSVIVRHHGAFAAGADLSEALYRMILVEDSCEMVCVIRSTGALKAEYHTCDPQKSSTLGRHER